MKTRNHVVLDRYGLGDSGTYTEDIDVQDPISEIEVRLDADNGATRNISNPLARCIDKIEVVDGSEVLYSLSGEVAIGAFAGLEGYVPNRYLTAIGSDTPYESFPIRFGRKLWDKEFALNPVAHRNPQLKVTWNLANVNTVGATGYLSGSLELSVNLKLMEEAPAPVGFLMSKEQDEFTTQASGDHRTELHTDYPYRALIVRAFESGVDIRNTITNLKLSQDGDRFIPFDMALEDLIYDWMNNNPPLHSNLLTDVSDNTFVETWIGMSLGGTLAPRSQGVFVGANYFWKGGALVYVQDDAGATQSNQDAFIHDVGSCYFNTVVIPFGNKMLVEDAFQAQQAQNLRLFLTQGNASGNVIVAGQQYRNY